MSHRSKRGPKLWVSRSAVRNFTIAALAASFVAGMVSTSSAITVYNRTQAVAYANANYNKVVGDGYFYKTSYPATLIGAGQPVPSGVTGDDCAHFVSSAIGSYQGTNAGGLTIPNRAGTYGEPGAARLDGLLVGDSVGGYGNTYKYGQLVSSVSQLTPGDVIGYDWDGSGNGSMSGIDHTALYIGNNQVDCHSNSRLAATWNLGGADNYFFIHITLPDAIVPNTPVNVSPAANSSITDPAPTLTAGRFSDGAIGSKHVAAQWQVLNARGTVYDSGTDTAHLTSLTVPAGKLNVGVTYTWQVRYQDNYGDWSSFSTPSSLSIIAPPLAGDFNNDGIVDAADFSVWRNGGSPSPNSQTDYDTWRANFGTTRGSGAAVDSVLSTSTVPEPAAAALMLFGALAGVSIRRR